MTKEVEQFTYDGKKYKLGDEVIVKMLTGDDKNNKIISRESSGRIILIDNDCEIDIKAFDTVKATIVHVAPKYSIIYPTEIVDRRGTPEMDEIVKQSDVETEKKSNRKESVILTTKTRFNIRDYPEIANLYAKLLTDPDHQTMISWDKEELDTRTAKMLSARRGKHVLVVIWSLPFVACSPFTEKLLDDSINIPYQLNEILQSYDKEQVLITLHQL